MAAKKSVRKAATSARTTPKRKAAHTFTVEERAAMREHVREVEAARSRPPGADGTSEVLARIAAMAPEDRAMGERCLWPTAFALKALDAATDAKITALVKRAVR